MSPPIYQPSKKIVNCILPPKVDSTRLSPEEPQLGYTTWLSGCVGVGVEQRARTSFIEVAGELLVGGVLSQFHRGGRIGANTQPNSVPFHFFPACTVVSWERNKAVGSKPPRPDAQKDRTKKNMSDDSAGTALANGRSPHLIKPKTENENSTKLSAKP